jgi:hypothetical protein
MNWQGRGGFGCGALNHKLGAGWKIPPRSAETPDFADKAKTWSLVCCASATLLGDRNCGLLQRMVANELIAKKRLNSDAIAWELASKNLGQSSEFGAVDRF